MKLSGKFTFRKFLIYQIPFMLGLSYILASQDNRTSIYVSIFVFGCILSTIVNYKIERKSRQKSPAKKDSLLLKLLKIGLMTFFIFLDLFVFVDMVDLGGMRSHAIQHRKIDKLAKEVFDSVDEAPKK